MEMINIDEIKRIEISILDYVVDICERNNLNYSLAFGTLLGAVRHKGFIPWDDDIDIHMPRPDYDKFIKITTSSSCDSIYKTLSFDTDSSYYYQFAKVVDSRTKVVETDLIPNVNMGVWIDIFPVDSIDRCFNFRRNIITLLDYFRILSVYNNVPAKLHKFGRILPFILFRFAKCFKPQLYISLMNYIATRGAFDQSHFSSVLIGRITSKMKFKSSDFVNCSLITFEGKQYKAPANVDEYLSIMYGDYMQLPPIEDRVTHKFNAYWK